MTHFNPSIRGKSFLSCFPLSDMNSAVAAQCLDSLYPYKILHLVRHAEGIHNVEGKTPEALLSQELFDAKLSPKGWQQVDNLREKVQGRGLAKKLDLVITSPLLRTMQTAVGAFGSRNKTTGSDIEKNEDNHDLETETSIPNAAPIIAVELCRERIGLHPCDKRRNINEYRSLFPDVDFQLIESEDDVLWEKDTRETIDKVAIRGMKFLKWLWTRREKEIAVVSHGIFLQQTLIALFNDAHLSVNEQELCKRFGNCEIRSVVIVDRSTQGSCLAENTAHNVHLLPSIVARESIPMEEISN